MAIASTIDSPAVEPQRLRHAVVWRWVHVAIAALAMVLTLPGRTHGLGLFTEPLLNSLALDRQSYGFMNLWATLLGALLCLPCGWLLDRFGTRAVLFFVTAGLGSTVMAMSQWTAGAENWTVHISLSLPSALGGPVAYVVMLDLFIFLLLTRGLGQSALSVVSLALIGRSAGRKSGLAMGVYAFCTTAGFMVAFMVLAGIVKQVPNDWRDPWMGIGLAVLVLGVVSSLLVRNSILDTGGFAQSPSRTSEMSYSFRQAMASPAFWTFTIAISFYGLIVAGTSLFNESILAERGFSKDIFLIVTQIGIPIGLAANLLVGWCATRWSLAKLMAVCTGLFAAALFAFPLVSTETQVYAYALTLAAAGGGMTVCFFAVYRRAFGPAHLGSIQGLAQMMTVLFSAVGPLIFASFKDRLGAYGPLFVPAAVIALVLAVLTWIVGMPGGATVSPAKLEA